MNYIIKKLDKNDWKDYRDIRLEALKSDSSAFGGSYEKCKNKSDSYWIDILSASDQDNGKSFLYTVLSNSNFISIGGAYQDENDKWNIFAIYTKKEFRVLGVGSLLFNEILEELKRRNIKKIFLRVNTERIPAVSLYKKYGFKILGVASDKILGDGKVYSEYEMFLNL